MDREAELTQEIVRLNAEIKRIRGNRFWHCPSCASKYQIKNLYIGKVHFYIQPSGCSDGDYWTCGREPEFQVFCPNCQTAIRYYKGRKNYESVLEYHYSFGGQISIHKLHYNSGNTYKIDKPLVNTEYNRMFGSALLNGGWHNLNFNWKNA